MDSFLSKDKNLYLWAILYMLVVYTFTLMLDQANIFVFIVYFLMALPFYNHLDKYALICFLLSTIAYYFMGADEAIWSIYTIFALLALLNLFTHKKFVIVNVLPFFLLIIAVYLSYSHSQFGYTIGALAIAYNLTIAIIVALTVKFEKDTLLTFFPLLASIQILMYTVVIIFGGYYDGVGIVPAVDISHNTFGLSTAQLGTILAVRVFGVTKKDKYYLTIWIISIGITLLSGSRNAFLGLIIASLFVFMYQQKKVGNVVSRYIKMAIVGSMVILFAIIVMPEFGFDITRFDYVSLIRSGGTNRIYLWSKLIPEIIDNYNIFGYGPSHFCSSEIIFPLVNRTYSHTHNLFLEAWGELGLIGLIPFIWLLILSVKKIRKKVKRDSSQFVLYAIFIEMMVNGIGESMFADIILWMLMGFIIGKSRRTTQIEQD